MARASSTLYDCRALNHLTNTVYCREQPLCQTHAKPLPTCCKQRHRSCCKHCGVHQWCKRHSTALVQLVGSAQHTHKRHTGLSLCMDHAMSGSLGVHRPCCQLPTTRHLALQVLLAAAASSSSDRASLGLLCRVRCTDIAATTPAHAHNTAHVSTPSSADML